MKKRFAAMTIGGLLIAATVTGPVAAAHAVTYPMPAKTCSSPYTVYFRTESRGTTKHAHMSAPIVTFWLGSTYEVKYSNKGYTAETSASWISAESFTNAWTNGCQL